MSDNNNETPKTETSEAVKSDNQKASSKEQTASEIPKVSKIKKQPDPDPTAQIRNDYLYLRAEFDNYKKNMIKERSDLLKYGGERLAYDILSVLDVFETALKTEINETNFKSFRNGIDITAVELRKTLEKHGIHEIPSLGAEFDPTLHEALTQAPTKDHKDNTVIDVFKKGYKYHDKVLRHSQVVVSKEIKD
jgi:molecular chaperone GrpE